jgi:signal transduction histidine kinase
MRSADESGGDEVGPAGEGPEVELARLRDELARANESKSRFVAAVSHELRTPLNAIVGYVELLEKGVPVQLPDEALAYVGRIRTSARHLIRVIDGILDLSRLEAGRETVELRRTSLDEVVDGVRAMMEPLAGSAGLELRVRMPEEGIVLETDPRKLRRILLNLVGNAVKFTRTGSVTLTVSLLDEGCRFEVEDTGIGIPEGRLGEIFEPFRQVGVPVRENDFGAGLGLTLARELVHLLGGEIQVHSREGTGTRFVVELPRVQGG